ncbi:hypothetical protein Dimus_020687 [Dionaea muscipula]
MEHSKELNNNSIDQKPLGNEGKMVPPCTGHGTKLRDIFMADKPTLSYAHFHGEITRNLEDSVPEALEKQHSCGSKFKAVKEDELIKYMSNVPSYLEKGKNFQVKALNVGVLDWEHLKKWQHSNRPMAQKHSGHHAHLGDSVSVRGRSRLTSESNIGANDSSEKLKHGSPSCQALLQVPVKNGLSLFTFAVDNNGDILAATLKSSAPGKYPSSWIYNFFTIQEIKRKNRIWPNQAPKKYEHRYVHNVVAQMKASDQCSPCSDGHKCVGHDDFREFVLFSVGVSQVDQHETEFSPTKELAAIVAKLPKTATCNPRKDGLLNNRNGNLSSASSLQCKELRHPYSGDDSENGSSVSHSALSTTVILPGGVHSEPIKGAVSTLIQRWKSGGSCDCGGWDLCCPLKIYSNQNDLENKLNSSCETSYFTDEFKLFSEASYTNGLYLMFLRGFCFKMICIFSGMS